MTTATRALTFLEPSLVYRLDAGISGSMGLCLFVLATPLATLVGWPPMQTILLGAGIFLLPWALFNWAIGAAGRADPISVTLNILGDGRGNLDRRPGPCRSGCVRHQIGRASHSAGLISTTRAAPLPPVYASERLQLYLPV
jgi:hypothetical protein